MSAEHVSVLTERNLIDNIGAVLIGEPSYEWVVSDQACPVCGDPLEKFQFYGQTQNIGLAVDDDRITADLMRCKKCRFLTSPYVEG